MARNFDMRIFLTAINLASTLLASIAHAATSLRKTDSRKLSLGIDNEQFYTLVSAADFTLMNGVAIKDTSSEGLRSVGLLDIGDYMAYRIDLPSTAMYQLQLYVSSPNGDGAVSIRDMATSAIYGTIESMPATGDWDEWDAISRNMTLPEGTSMLKLEVIESGWDLLWLSVTQLDSPPATIAPSLIQTGDSSAKPSLNSSSVEPALQEQDSSSAEPISSQQNSSTAEPTFLEQNSSTIMPSLPPQEFCLESIAATDYVSMNGSDLEEGMDFVKMYAGEWAAYTITAPSDGTYMLQFKAMDTRGGSAFEVMDMETSQQYAEVESMQEAPAWKNVNTVMDLSAGSHTLQVRILNGCWKLASLCLQEIESMQSSSGGSNGCSCGGCGCGGFTQPEIHIHNHIYNEGSYNDGGNTAGSNGGYPTTNHSNTETDVGYPSDGIPNSGTPGSPNYGNPSNGIPDSGTPGTGTPGSPNYGNPSNGIPNSGIPGTGTPGSPNYGIPTNPSTGTPDSGTPGVPNSGTNFPPDSGTPSFPNSGPNTSGDGGDPSPPTNGAPTQPNAGNSGPGTPADAGEPGDPSPPADPSDPSDPALPALPASPSNPADPASSSDPSPPALPSSPALPADPSSPALPSSPSLPSNPNPLGSGGCDVVIPANNYRGMSGIDSENSVEGLTNVGWFDPGDWLEYDVTLPKEGTYRMSYRISSPSGEGRFTLTSEDVAQVYGSVDSFQSTGGWQSWYTDAVDVTLPAGPQTLRINISEGGWNLAWFCLAAMR